MSETIITSRDNALVKHARAVRDGKIREQFFIEGVRLCEEAVKASLVVQDVICSEKLARDERGARLLDTLRSVSRRIAFVNTSVFASLSDTKTPQGIVALCLRPETGRSVLPQKSSEASLVVIMHRVSNPANAGAILRAAEAAGASAAILTAGTTDIFSPKALRGAMGSSFRLPLWTGATYEEALLWCKEHGIGTICADLRARRAHTEIDWTQPSALIVGAEATGLTPDESVAADQMIRIPMRGAVESLNVAVAAAIVLYEAARQREK
jgi:TrmH family RNA methyltransferase